MVSMYDVPTNGCNLTIMGWPFFVEEITPNEAFRRREMNTNNIVGGTQKITKGAYVGLDFTVVTHIRVRPNKPGMYNNVFRQMMEGPVVVDSPEFGGRFRAMVTIKPEHDSPRSLKLTITIKEVPGTKSLIPGESFTIPKTRKITIKKEKKHSAPDKSQKGGKSVNKTKRTTAPKKNKSKKQK